MSQINHLYDIPLEKEIEACPECKKVFACSEEDQVPGCRDKDYKRCPYCDKELDSSMSVEYQCSKLSESDIEYLVSKGVKINKEGYMD